MTTLWEIASLVLVGVLWGCTNPLLREGYIGATSVDSPGKNDNPTNMSTPILTALRLFLHFRVWIPYAVNQLGSILFYYALANSDLSLAVPICNGLSLVFSMMTSYLIGEPVVKPLRTFVGAALVMAGVAVCVSCSDDET